MYSSRPSIALRRSSVGTSRVAVPSVVVTPDHSDERPKAQLAATDGQTAARLRVG